MIGAWSRSFEAEATSVASVRRFVRDVCTLNEINATSADAFELVVNELATNSVLHGGSAFRVDLWVEEGVARVAVSDRSRSLPPMGPRAATPAGQSHGRGLEIVDGLAESWGVLPLGSEGKMVWASVSSREGPVPQGPAPGAR